MMEVLPSQTDDDRFLLGGPSSEPSPYPSPLSQSAVPYSPFSPSSPSTQKATEDVEAIRVVCRFRPVSDLELQLGAEIAVQYPEGNDRAVSIQAEGSVKSFQFSRVFNADASQEDVYNYSAKPMVQDVLNGCSASIIAYGQTGAGKTYTMQGPGFDDSTLRERGYEGLLGIIPRVVQDIFQAIAAAPTDVRYEIAASYLEIYQEKIRDLLETNKVSEHHSLPLMDVGKKGGLVVPSARQVPVYSAEEIISIMRTGARNRVVAATNANDESSRSHAVFLVTVTRISGGARRYAQLYLVDLAGSEKVSKTLAEGTRLSEAKYINKSLLALGNVIHALVAKKKHIPYRDSKLTRLLKNSLGGNAKTTLIINCSPSVYNAHETLSTLRFGDRTSKITNFIKINEQRSPEVLEALLAEKEHQNEEQRQYIRYLEAEIMRLTSAQGSPVGGRDGGEDREKGKEKELVHEDATYFDTPKKKERMVVSGGETMEYSTPLPRGSSPLGKPAPTIPATEPINRVSQMHSLKKRRNTLTQGEELVGGRDYFMEAKLQMEREQASFRKDMIKKDMMHFLCPMTRKVFKDPVVCMDGHTYERDAMEVWLKRHNRSPLTGNKLSSKTLLPNYAMKKLLAFKRQMDVTFSLFDFFSLLPSELLIHIFEYLDYTSLGKCEQVCYTFMEAVRYEGLWKTMLWRDYRELKEPSEVAPRTLRQHYSKLHNKNKQLEKEKRVSPWRGVTLFKT